MNGRIFIFPVVEILFVAGYKLLRLAIRPGPISFGDAGKVISGLFKKGT